MKLNNKINIFLSLSLIVSVIYLLIYNIINYDPLFGYDAEAHHSYIDFIAMYLPRTLELPTVNSTREFFNPPLPYFFPAFVQLICRNIINAENLLETCRPVYGKVTQIFQAVLYLISIFMYLKIVKLIRNEKKFIDFAVLLIFCILTVNYKTFLMIRGEPYIIFFNSILLYRFLVLSKNSFKHNYKDIIIFGTLIGGLALSRQWAFLLFPAYFLLIFFIHSSSQKRSYFKFVINSFIIGFLISSWFYINLFIEYGSFTAFNQEPSTFNISNQPLSFYLPLGVDISYLFTKPIRPYFSNTFIPILYSDLWGDYWGYFSFTSKSLSSGRDQMLIGDYLAKVNIVSLFPTFLMIMGVKYSINSSNKLADNLSYFYIYITISVFTTVFGYLWFLIKYPAFPTGDTIKATYMIQLFHMLSLLSLNYLYKLKEFNPKKYKTFIVILCLIFIHNFKAMMSHF